MMRWPFGLFGRQGRAAVPPLQVAENGWVVFAVIFENAGAWIAKRVWPAVIHRPRQRLGMNRSRIARRRCSAFRPSRSKPAKVACMSGVKAMPSTALIRAKPSRPSVKLPVSGWPARRGRPGINLRMRHDSTAQPVGRNACDKGYYHIRIGLAIAHRIS